MNTSKTVYDADPGDYLRWHDQQLGRTVTGIIVECYAHGYDITPGPGPDPAKQESPAIIRRYFPELRAGLAHFVNQKKKEETYAAANHPAGDRDND